VAQTADIERVIRLVEIALIIGRNIVLIISAIVAITIALAAYNFATGSIAWGIVNSLLGLGGLVFLAQIRQTRRRHYGRQTKYREMKQQKYREAEAA
jgi:hypothetical protein